jgi:hypothetical protein
MEIGKNQGITTRLKILSIELNNPLKKSMVLSSAILGAPDKDVIAVIAL